MKDLTKGPVLKTILLFTIPMILGQLFQLFYNIADTRIVGSMLGDQSLAAVGAVTSISDLLLGFFSGLANGFSVAAAKYFGAGDEKKIKQSFANGLMIGSGMAAGTMLVCLLLVRYLLQLIHVPPEQLADSSAYISIIIAGVLFSFWYNLFAGMLRAIGDAVTPLYFLILASFLNVGLDLLFIGPGKMGVQGAAFATILSQAVSAALCLLYLWKKYELLHFSLKDCKAETGLRKNLLGCGISMGLMSSLISIGSLILQSVINGFGTATIVAHTAARKLTILFMTPYIFLGQAMATFTGQNFGAGKTDRIKEGIRKVTIVGLIWSLLVVLITYWFVPDMVQALTDTKSAEVVATANRYLRFDTLFYGFLVPIFVLRNVLQALGDHKTPLVSSCLEMLGKVVAAFTLGPMLGYFGIILTEPLVWVIMVIPLLIQIRKLLWEK